MGILASLFVNYASETTPQILKQRPYLVWIIIIVLVFITTGLSYWQSNHQSRPRKPQRNNILNDPERTRIINNQHDVFISYSSDDVNWVQQTLKPFLIERGFSVKTDKEFRGGGLSVEQMANGVSHSRHVLAIMTPSFMNSEWTKLETAMTLLDDPAGKFRKLIPILLDDCTIPNYIKVRHYRDMRDDNGWDELVEDLM